MFNRWFKARGPAVPLDLTKHLPQEFQEQSVVLNGREYTIGGKVRDTDQGYAHRLNNTLSPPACQVLERGIANCPDKTLIKPEVHQMTDLLRQFAAMFDAAPAPLKQ